MAKKRTPRYSVGSRCGATPRRPARSAAPESSPESDPSRPPRPPRSTKRSFDSTSSQRSTLSLSHALTRHYVGILLFFAFSVVAFLTYRDYGIAWDEPEHVYLSNITAQYALSGDPTLLTYYARDHGVAFELLLWALNDLVLRPRNLAAVYSLRHLITHLFFLTGCLAFFLLLNDLYANSWLSTLGFLMLALTPTIYGHSFFNSKDIPFMSMFPICLYFSNRLFRTYDYRSFVCLGLCCAILMNIRIMGIVFPALLLSLLPFRDPSSHPGGPIRLAKQTSVLVITLAIALVLSWPALWPDPLGGLTYAFKSFSRYDWNYSVLFKGDMIPAAQLPRSYTITWFVINIPLYILVLGLFGFLAFIARMTRLVAKAWKSDDAGRCSAMARILSRPEHKIALCNCGVVVGSLGMIFVLHPVVYDSWRHSFFIYPSFVMMSVYGLHWLGEHMGRVKIVMYCMVCACMVQVGLYMVEYYPHYHVYFNELVSRQPGYLKSRYEMDYWGVSGKQALEHVLKSDPRERLVFVFQGLPSHNVMTFSGSKDEKRIGVADNLSEADYLVTNYRWVPDVSLPYPRVFTLTVLNSSILSVYKITKT